ncbi:MAG: hypothetical protein SCM11_19705, partial [Bacillota bacterium]|nr:hypothetical protein [Bacillota bacterium]
MRYRDMILTDEQQYPHAPECAVHNTVDNGFARGFGAHFHPVPEYFADCHVHYAASVTGKPILEAAERYLALVAPLGIQKLVLLPPVSVSSKANALIHPSDVRLLNPHVELTLTRKNLAWLIYLRHDMPDDSFVKEAIDKGCQGLKLHMAPMVVSGADYRIFLNPAWKRVFDLLEQ